MGTYRFVLALAVVVGHTGFAPDAFGLGVCAVVSFLILSGYVMTLLAERYYASPDRVLLFYLDRAGRIFPQFLFYLTITIVLVNQHRIGFGFASSCSSGDALYNALALPLSWSQLIGIDCQYLPQAWSVGLELSFYLAVPWLL
jgi:peptidoglycan/LPS O-acetylase OafA/YrhL